MPKVASARISGFAETVFAFYTRLAQRHDAVNLGQGFPDFDPPGFVREALHAAADDYQQYAPLPGMPALTSAVAADMGARLGRELDPAANVQVTVGATEALFAAMQALIDDGDDVVLFEPFYDAYPADVTMAGGTARFVPLRPQADGSWQYDPDELARTFSRRTKAVVLNTPHNPTGKVFTAGELDHVIALAEAVGAIVISDEVYEHISFRPHMGPAMRPGAWERTLTIGSFGKTFSATGWKIGWAVGPESLIQALRLAHQWIPFAVATPLQQAAANALAHAASSGYYRELRDSYQAKRDLLLEGLKKTPFTPWVPDGGYFIMADSSNLPYRDDLELCRDLPQRAGVAAIPPSAFYLSDQREQARHMVRFSFCKTDAALIEAARRLAQAF